ncbi:uncharacterized protein LOC123315893 [Coccinella septempunctata]|uniref:uncharacterized protein LOC123315893 n=1 Tax=Coccinella septempunctata TaxID=41139 RepID=UPI001D07565F|nr:uncharacterized protein LOC123315893 [Coccinella septempunctata]
MFRQVLVAREHQDFQLILWRFSPSEPIKEFRLRTLVFGIKSSPFLAMRCIRQLAEEHSYEFPEACAVLQDDIFVNDIVSGSDSLSGAIQLQTQLTEVLSRAGFELRKWSSNNADMLQHLTASVSNSQPLTLDLEPDSVIKILGLQWNPSTDAFSYSVQPISKTCTKRNILSELARIYDPLGFLTPFVLYLKHLIQRLWTLGLDWDDAPPKDLVQMWPLLKSEMCHLTGIAIPRLIISAKMRSCQLHGFCDASNVGYAAVAYVRVVDELGHIATHLLCAKSRVAPLKRVSIPRLELCAALLLAELLDRVQVVFGTKLVFDKVFAYSDSNVALSWIRSSPYKWTCFVSNRVTLIQEKVPPSVWNHVTSGDNPADPASRGVAPVALLKLSLWWAGPSWLQWPECDWPTNHNISFETNEERRQSVFATIIDEEKDFLQNLLDNVSSFPKVQRVVAYVKRFVFNCRNPNGALKGTVTSMELESALTDLIRSTQISAFSREMLLLKKGNSLPKCWRKLTPFLDKLGILRVGGRLVNSRLGYDQVYPILLPSRHRFTELMIEYTHRKYLHAGLQTLNNLIIQRYWIFSAKRTIRRILAKCNRCFRVRPLSSQPLMGDLPAVRVTQVKPFLNVGVDYGGPFFIIMNRVRGTKTLKAYICLFVCMVTKAIHLELASDLSADTFLAALRRFISRRGQCLHIYSDQGTAFRGAANQLRKLMKEAADTENIEFHNIPPVSPNFGGIWEAGIKSVKTHLIRVVGDQRLTYEEFNTVLAQIEAVLNSRPISPLSTDPNDLNPLTPGHFLTLAPLNSLPENDLLDCNMNKLSRWQLVQKISQEFWSRWHKEYLHTLLQRSKWTNPSVPIELNTLVLLKDELSPPLKWHLGRVIELHSGADKVTRVVTVKTLVFDSSASLKKTGHMRLNRCHRIIIEINSLRKRSR